MLRGGLLISRRHFEPPDPMISWKRAVIKVGSNLLAPDGRALKKQNLLRIAALVTSLRSLGREVILVSSGAVAAGRARLRQEPQQPTSMPGKQALAAIGQAQLMAAWAPFFDMPCAQVLLTHDDLSNRRRFVNAQNTLRALLDLGCLPIINENDSVAVEELRVGDNDNLAAHVAVLADADLLVILTDIDALYDADPRSVPGAKRIAEVPEITPEVLALAGGTGSAVGTGGMRTKLEAAAKASARGIATVLCDGANDAALAELLAGGNPGTWFHAATSRISARAHWLRHGLPAQGRVAVDAGAARALESQGASLLAVGVTGVDGVFRAGDCVEIVDASGQVRARGLVQYDAAELKRILGRNSADIERILGVSAPTEVIHRDDLVRP